MDGHLDHHPRAAPHVPRDVIVWRRSLLTEAGFGPELAQELSGHAEYDLHDLLNLVDRGCPPALAARILAPL
jgi:hypothetical protein